VPPLSTAVWALTVQGCDLARRVAARLGGVVCVPRRYAAHPAEQGLDRIAAALAADFHAYRRHVCIAATGIVVRTIGPLLRDKASDPAVVVVDHNGRFAISLLSGHLGGANDLARQVAAITGGRAVITTATDNAGLPAMDVLARDLNLAAWPTGGLQAIATALLDGEQIQVFDPEHHLRPALQDCLAPDAFAFLDSAEAWTARRPGIWVSWRADAPRGATLCLVPRCIMAGLGCHPGVHEHEIVSLVHGVFAAYGLSVHALHTLGSVQSRSREPGLHAAAQSLGADTAFFTPAELNRVPIPHPSPAAARLIGTESVCEAAALLLARSSTLLIPKTKAPGLTLAAALTAALTTAPTTAPATAPTTAPARPAFPGQAAPYKAQGA
jgi:cobalt-precorrin 5A hydrolase